MSENFVARTGAVQDTGNPVFDATCNLIMNWPTGVCFHSGGMDGLHTDLLALYNKEPRKAVAGARPTSKTLSQMHHDAQTEEIGAR
jgi:hypothetical protein